MHKLASLSFAPVPSGCCAVWRGAGQGMQSIPHTWSLGLAAFLSGRHHLSLVASLWPESTVFPNTLIIFFYFFLGFAIYKRYLGDACEEVGTSGSSPPALLMSLCGIQQDIPGEILLLWLNSTQRSVQAVPPFPAPALVVPRAVSLPLHGAGQHSPGVGERAPMQALSPPQRESCEAPFKSIVSVH